MPLLPLLPLLPTTEVGILSQLLTLAAPILSRLPARSLALCFVTDKLRGSHAGRSKSR
jgi:hypothetical protein